MNSFGRAFVVTVFGESHGRCVGAVVDGCPAGLPLTVGAVQADVDKRRPTGGPAATARAEADRVEILSGLHQGRTTGAPLTLVIWNRDVDDTDYERIKDLARPGHADYTARLKYGGFNDARGGGQFSGRMTAACVMAGAVARQLLGTIGVEVAAHTVEIGGIEAKPADFNAVKASATDPLRCADAEAAAKMNKLIEQARKDGDSLGGVVEGMAVNLPVGLGEPYFDTLDGELARALFSVPAVKGVAFGAGFGAARLKGSQNNDAFIVRDGKIATATNNAGGVLGGLASGSPLVVRVAVKPTPSIAREQKTVNLATLEETTVAVGGRHDACIVPRAVAAVEAMMAVTLADFVLRAGAVPRTAA